jgi:UDP-N-acetyl-D-galactosamine dehydrogenase
VDVHDPVVDPAEARHEYGQAVLGTFAADKQYDAVVLAVSHDAYAALPAAGLTGICRSDAIVYDIKGLWRDAAIPAGLRYLTL